MTSSFRQWLIKFSFLAVLLHISKSDASVARVSDFSAVKLSEPFSVNQIPENSNNSFEPELFKSQGANSTTTNGIVVFHRVFHYFNNVLIVVLNIIFGAILNIDGVKTILKRPIGMLVAFLANFVFLPLVSVQLREMLEIVK